MSSYKSIKPCCLNYTPVAGTNKARVNSGSRAVNLRNPLSGLVPRPPSPPGRRQGTSHSSPLPWGEGVGLVPTGEGSLHPPTNMELRVRRPVLRPFGPDGPERARKVPWRDFLPVGNSGAKPQKNHRQAGIWSMSKYLPDALLLGYYMEDDVGVESRTKARCRVSGVRC